MAALELPALEKGIKNINCHLAYRLGRSIDSVSKKKREITYKNLSDGT